MDGVSFDLRAGEVHGLVGETAPERATLVNLLTGVHRADHGEIRVDDQPVSFSSPRDAADAGICVIHQELAFVGSLDVATLKDLAPESRRSTSTSSYSTDVPRPGQLPVTDLEQLTVYLRYLEQLAEVEQVLAVSNAVTWLSCRAITPAPSGSRRWVASTTLELVVMSTVEPPRRCPTVAEAPAIPGPME